MIERVGPCLVVVAGLPSGSDLLSPCTRSSLRRWPGHSFARLSGFVLSLLYVAAESWIHSRRRQHSPRPGLQYLYACAAVGDGAAPRPLRAEPACMSVFPFLLASALFVAAIGSDGCVRSRPPRDAPPEPFGIVSSFRALTLWARRDGPLRRELEHRLHVWSRLRAARGLFAERDRGLHGRGHGGGRDCSRSRLAGLSDRLGSPLDLDGDVRRRCGRVSLWVACGRRTAVLAKEISCAARRRN